MNFNSATLRRFQDISSTLVDIPLVDDYRYEAVDRLSHMFSASVSAFMHWADAEGSASNLRPNDMYFDKMDQQLQDQYYSEVRDVCPISCWATNNQHGRRVGTLHSMLSSRQLKSSPLYQKILVPSKNCDILVILLKINKRLLGSISLARPAGAPEYDHADIRLAQMLAPTLSAIYCNLVLAEELARAQQKHLKADDTQPKMNLPSSSSYGLSKRELQVLNKVFEGLNSTEIGDQLRISPWTVKNHIQSIYRKTGVNNRVSLLKVFTSPPREDN